nr:MAG TPA: hypothetical protein [Caudoviricetes sp.]
MLRNTAHLAVRCMSRKGTSPHVPDVSTSGRC